MKIVITDSGFGGLGIAARLHELLKTKYKNIHFDIVYVNGLPNEKYGFNSITDLQQKIDTFNDLLLSIESKLNPDLIVIACNTLSVLFNKTSIYNEINRKTIDIIHAGTHSIVKQLKTESDLLLAILGTQTTINSMVHFDYFKNYPQIFRTILNIPCTELVTAIENDCNSDQTQTIINNCLSEIRTLSLQKPYSKIALILACTHFPYAEHLFQISLKKIKTDSIIINPNIGLIEQILEFISKSISDSTEKGGLNNLRIISKTKVHDALIKSISDLIQNISADTVKALKQYAHKSDFYITPFDKNIEDTNSL